MSYYFEKPKTPANIAENICYNLRFLLIDAYTTYTYIYY